MEDNPNRIYRLNVVAHITGSIHKEETFSDLPEDADEETVRRYTRVYIMMLLLMQLFGDKSDTCMHIRWMGSPDVVQVVHSKILEPGHTVLWRAVTAFIYFVVIE
ncbi:hypothetical protein Ahy_A03g014916 [Arachis hypogaea]|uniref:Uncharacterized protein n=1 Tax=Arachis hypogaea TaxID=3818 RepID=A0A445DZ34_ARAHY|nr:hypothetical protein Ahy_A03g014916 [Arachis hypogaea]